MSLTRLTKYICLNFSSMMVLNFCITRRHWIGKIRKFLGVEQSDIPTSILHHVFPLLRCPITSAFHDSAIDVKYVTAFYIHDHLRQLPGTASNSSLDHSNESDQHSAFGIELHPPSGRARKLWTYVLGLVLELHNETQRTNVDCCGLFLSQPAYL